jgi:ABC-2 type transport system ATP-binding protein
MADKVIETRNLTKLYGTVVGVRDLELEVERGEVFGFLGPNGAGKTTTIRLLMGLLRPSAGQATVLGLDAWGDSVAVKKEVGYLPGEAALYERMTGEGHIKFVAGFNGKGEEEGFQLAESLELELGRKASTYSRGMKQKLAIILALMKNPPLIIMDEPSNALDPLTQKLLYDILNERRNNGATILFSSHNLPEVERLADRVGIIRQGTLAGTERIEDLREKRLRNVEIIFEGGLPADLALESLPGVTGIELLGTRVQLKLKGDINPLLKLVSRYEVADFSVSHASLEDVFLEFYEQPEAADEDAGGMGAEGDAP